MRTLWFNTGSLCNIECATCYLESGPKNDRLAYLTCADIAPFLDEAAALAGQPIEIGLTGGEPFMNPEIIQILDMVLGRGHELLILTNAMRPMMRPPIRAALEALGARYAGRLKFRVSLDHYSPARHDRERGAGAWGAAMAGLEWLLGRGFPTAVAGRLKWGETEMAARAGYGRLFAERGLAVDARARAALVLFPEMRGARGAPEITEDCWARLGLTPREIMCATSRMVVKRRGAARPAVLACTLLPYEREFELAANLRDSFHPISLNHPYCAEFCVLGGASCS